MEHHEFGNLSRAIPTDLLAKIREWLPQTANKETVLLFLQGKHPLDLGIALTLNDLLINHETERQHLVQIFWEECFAFEKLKPLVPQFKEEKNQETYKKNPYVADDHNFSSGGAYNIFVAKQKIFLRIGKIFVLAEFLQKSADQLFQTSSIANDLLRLLSYFEQKLRHIAKRNKYQAINTLLHSAVFAAPYFSESENEKTILEIAKKQDYCFTHCASLFIFLFNDEELQSSGENSARQELSRVRKL